MKDSTKEHTGEYIDWGSVLEASVHLTKDRPRRGDTEAKTTTVDTAYARRLIESFLRREDMVNESERGHRRKCQRLPPDSVKEVEMATSPGKMTFTWLGKNETTQVTRVTVDYKTIGDDNFDVKS
jgi:hypothetical protein